MNNLVVVHIKSEDLLKLRDKCKPIYRKYHPDAVNFKISDYFILGETIRKYIEDDENA